MRTWRQADVGLPAEARGRWCSVTASIPGAPQAALAHVDFIGAAGEPVAARLHLSQQARQGVCFIPSGVEHAQLELWGTQRPLSPASITYRPVGTAGAATRLLAARPALLAQLARQIGPVLPQAAAVKEQLREVLGAAIQAEAPVRDYRLWHSLFDFAPEELPPEACGLSLGFIVSGGDAGPAAAATLAALKQQHGPAPPVAVTGANSGLPEALASLPGRCDYIGLLQAGEILAPHASTVIRSWMPQLGLPGIAYADEDGCQAGSGLRGSPLFKPEPNRALMVSGTLSRGLWLVRRSLLADVGSLPERGGAWSELLRLGLWLRLHEAGGTRAGGTRRIPFVLAHRRPDTSAAPPAELAKVVDGHCRRAGLPFDAAPGWPLQVTARPLASPARITVIVPSALRSEDAERCICAVLAGTRHTNFELVVAVSQPGPLDASQRASASRIEADSRARVLLLEAEQFNFSSTNNRAAAATAGHHVLLLNDDVHPIRPDWLDAMAAHLADPAVGVVGAKLLYPNGTVQHGGVIMGLAGLCDHAHRHLHGDAPGYAGRAVLAQELSAVTGACLLIRRPLLEQVGGLDERYPSAFNDVDLCLRVREAGYAVVFAPEAVLHHHELRTYGSHYAAERAPFRDQEAARMRKRWGSVIAQDPFHSMNLSLVPGQEWEPAFPPRLRRP